MGDAETHPNVGPEFLRGITIGDGRDAHLVSKRIRVVVGLSDLRSLVRVVS